MMEIKLRESKRGYYLVDNTGLIIVKELSEKQAIQFQDYKIRKLSDANAVKPIVEDEA